MKKFCLTTTIAVFLLIFVNVTQAQTVTPKLDQLKLAQELFPGTYHRVISKDSTEVGEIQQYENSFVQNNYLVVKSKKSFLYGIIMVFTPKEDNFKCFWYRPNGSYSTLIGSFTTENKFSSNRVQNFNTEKVLSRAEGVYETPTNYTATFFKTDGTKGGVYKWTKVK